MKNIYFTVGPSQLYPTLKNHLQIAIREDVSSQSHRGPWFHELFTETTGKLKQLLSIPESHDIFFCSSGTEAMERAIQNLVEKKSLHIINGAFSKRFASTAKGLGRETNTYDLLNNVILNEVKDPLKTEQDILRGVYTERSRSAQNDNIELICFTQNDTSTGIWIEPKIITQTKKNNPDVFIAVDIVSSAPYVNLDYKYIDCAFFSVQKLFGLPAGLGIMIISPQAMEKSSSLFKKGVSTGSYHSFQTLLKYAQKRETPETPPVLEIWLLNKALGDMLKTGIKNIRIDIKERAIMLYDFFDNHAKWKPFVSDPEFRSQTTLAIDFSGQADEVKKKLQEQGLIVGSGYGEFKGKHLRFANFPAHRKEDIERLIETLATIT